MVPRKLVPSLAGLVLAASVSAVDGVAPVTILQQTDPLLAMTADARPAGILGSLDLGSLATSCFAYDVVSSTWQSFTPGFSSPQPATISPATSGIAVVGITGSGTWEYGHGTSWTPIGTPTETAAVLIPLLAGPGTPNLLRFLPDGGAQNNDVATLDFRIWDGSSGSLTTVNDVFAGLGITVYGGSPTAFSAEKRTVQSTVFTSNQPPVVSGSPPWLVDCIPTQVQTLLATTTPFSDPEGDPLGIAIRKGDPVNTIDGLWEYSLDGSTWISLPDTLAGMVAGDSLLLPPDAWLRWSASATATPPAGPLTIRAWDGQEGSAGSFLGASTSISAASTTVEVQMDSPPVVTSVNGNPIDGPVHLVVYRNTTAFFSCEGYDSDAGDVLAWSTVVSGYYGGASIPDPGFSTSFSYTPPTDPTITSVQITLQATDLAGSTSTPVQLDVTILDDHPPVISTRPIAFSIRQGETLPFTAAASDPDPGDDATLGWTVLHGEVQLGTVDLGAAIGTQVAATYHATGQPGQDSFSLQVADTAGFSDQLAVDVTVVANLPPALGSSIGTIAVAGEPYDALATAVDADSPASALSVAAVAYGSAWPTWLQFSSDHGHGHLTGTPPAGTSGSFTIRILTSDEFTTVIDDTTITVVPAQSAALTLPALAVSDPSAPSYALIAPGSADGFASVDSTFAGLFPAQARGLWWSAGYVDLPTLPPEPATAGLFLATTVPRTLALSAPAQAAPFALDLPAGGSSYARWHLIGIPPVVTAASPVTVATAHPWTDFRLETADGVAVSDPATVLDVLATGSDPDPAVRIQPLTWDPAAHQYVRSPVVASGTGYWVPNFAGSGYRLVRGLAGDANNLGDVIASLQPSVSSRHATIALAAAPARAWPPAPPAGGAASTAAEGGSGGCGAGGLAGLLAAALACFGLRRGRRT